MKGIETEEEAEAKDAITYQSEVSTSELGMLALKNHAIATQNSFARNPTILAVAKHPSTASDIRYGGNAHSIESESNFVLPSLD